MERDPDLTKDPTPPAEPPSEEAPPPFEPDPELVTFLERGAKRDVRKWWRETEPKDARGEAGAAFGR